RGCAYAAGMNLLVRGLVRAVYVLAAVAVAGSAASWLAWRGAPPLPGNREAARIAAQALPGCPVPEADRLDPPFTIASDSVELGRVRFEYADPEVNLTGTARESLRAAGWSIGREYVDRPAGVDPYVQRGFRADKGSLSVRWQTAGAEPRADFDVVRRPPSRVAPITAAGIALGALAGWWLGGLAPRRRRIGAYAVIWTVTGVVLLALPVADGLTNLVTGSSGADDLDAMPFWEAFAGFGAVRGMTALAAVAVVVTVAAEWRVSRSSAGRCTRPGPCAGRPGRRGGGPSTVPCRRG
ncbi:MAG: hypothetical protein QOJ50_795, partial [Cryptosporangiaceae bacterium]|nr:hypothetical protein [Cryptosporangiaceae bacterium]